jgi:undecaprenyl-diphosphatase
MPAPELPLRHAIALGVLQGPAELLPISSSGHVALVPWLLGWPYPRLEPELRKSFEVALHAGTAAALIIALRGEVAEAARGFDGRRGALVGLSFLPPAVAGLTLERWIERRLGTPETIAAGLVAGALAMLWADRRPQLRHHDDADWRDAAWLGLAQSCALVPGVSRNGATLAAGRLRQFTREDANRLSRHVALPVIVGASVLKGVRLAGRGLGSQSAIGLAGGAAAAFASTLAAARLLPLVERDRSLAPYAVYRLALAGLVIRRLRHNR